MPDTRELDPFARRLFEQALLLGSFTLRSGAMSDRYFDKYRVSCDPTLLAETAGRLWELVREQPSPPARIVAPALGAVPLAAALALASGIPFAIVRDASKGYGTDNRLEGPFEPGERAVLVEDVVTSGGAALDALQVARDAGLVVDRSLCVLDRDGGGREALAAAGAPLRALLDARQLDAAVELGIGLRTPAESGT